jgi:hypothetical protein
MNLLPGCLWTLRSYVALFVDISSMTTETSLLETLCYGDNSPRLGALKQVAI